MPLELQVRLLRVLETGDRHPGRRRAADRGRRPRRRGLESGPRRRGRRRAASAPTCSTGCASCRSTLPPLRDRGGRRRRPRPALPRRARRASRAQEKDFSDAALSRRSRPTPGRATCASCATPSTRPSSWPESRSGRAPSAASRCARRRRGHARAATQRPHAGQGLVLELPIDARRGRAAAAARHPRALGRRQGARREHTRHQPQDPLLPPARVLGARLLLIPREVPLLQSSWFGSLPPRAGEPGSRRQRAPRCWHRRCSMGSQRSTGSPSPCGSWRRKAMPSRRA